MKINLHIDHVVLDGITIAGNEKPVLQNALAKELTQLLNLGLGTEGRLNHFHTGRLTGGHIRVASTDAARIGGQLARAVHGELA